MKSLNRRIRKSLLVLTLVFSFPLFTTAQIDGDFFKGGINDGVKLIEAYMSPWAKAFGAGLNGGWYNTAKPHKLGGFDITLSVSTGIVPDAHQTFDLEAIDFQHISLEFPEQSSISPTIAGSTTRGPALQRIDPGTGLTLANFYAPQGTGLRYVPAPMIQVGIGLPKGTEIKGRFIPKIGIDGASIGMWGAGLKHSVLQYLPGSDFIPADVSVFGGFSKIEGRIPFDVKPEYYSDYTLFTQESFMDQFMLGTIQAWNVNLIGSLNLPIITLYGGAGFASSKTVLEISGNIPTPTIDPSGPAVVYVDEGVINDIDKIDIEDFSGVRLNAGLRLKFAVFTIHADYTYAQYSLFTGGLGISFR